MENQSQEKIEQEERMRAEARDKTERGAIKNRKKYNKPAIVGFILSIVSIFGLGIAGLVGFILGIVALIQIKHTKEKGKWLAITAIVIGFLWSFVKGILKQLVEAGF